MRRRRRRKTHWSIWLLLIGLLAIALVTLFLIHRGAKVQGPNDTSIGSTNVIDTTPTTSAGTYTASGSATDPDGEALTVKVYLTLTSKHRFSRELKIQGDSVRMIVDAGTYAKTAHTLKLHSTNAVVFQYQSVNHMNNQMPSRKSRYGTNHSAYPAYLTNVLNNTISTKGAAPSAYAYGNKHLKLTISGAVVPSVNEAIDEQAEIQSRSTASTAQAASATSNSSAASSVASASSASSASSSSHLSVEQAQALIEAKYPPSDYTTTAMGEQAGTFSFVVINKQTRQNQTVTVDQDGTIQ